MRCAPSGRRCRVDECDRGDEREAAEECGVVEDSADLFVAVLSKRLVAPSRAPEPRRSRRSFAGGRCGTRLGANRRTGARRADETRDGSREEVEQSSGGGQKRITPTTPSGSMMVPASPTATMAVGDDPSGVGVGGVSLEFAFWVRRRGGGRWIQLRSPPPRVVGRREDSSEARGGSAVARTTLGVGAAILPNGVGSVRGSVRRRFVDRGRPPLSDAVLALVFVVVGQVDVWSPWGDEFPRGGFDGPSALNAALVLLYTAPVAWRRRAPTAALAVMVAAAWCNWCLVSPTVLFFGGLLPTVVMAYSVALYERPGPRLPRARDRRRRARDRRGGDGAGERRLRLGVRSAAAGRRVGHGSARPRPAAPGGAGQARTRRRGRAAAAEERARIARELHDLVAHGVSVMGIQAAAAQALLDRDPEAARAAMVAVERMSRDALSEMHHLVGVLRDGVADDAALAPQPGLGDLAALLADVRGAGLPSSSTIEGDRRDSRPGWSSARIGSSKRRSRTRSSTPARPPRP